MSICGQYDDDMQVLTPLKASQLRVALIAHDGKKADIVILATDFKPFLATCKLCATGTTGLRIAQATGLKLERFLSGTWAATCKSARGCLVARLTQ